MSLRIYIIRRIFQSVPLLFIISVLTYLLMSLAPGDVVALFEDPNSSHFATQFIRDQILERLGLNVPIHVQYFNWIKEIIVEVNLGFSFMDEQPVSKLIFERIGATLTLTGTAIIMSLLIAIPIGIYSAVKKNSFIDIFFSFTSYLGISTPTFFLELIFILFFSLKLEWFPASGMRSEFNNFDLIDRIKHLILPATVLSFGIVPAYTRYIRTNMLEVLNQDYIQAARAKGLSEFKIIVKHAFRNALIPFITIVALQLPILVGGAFIIEHIFSWPGLGRLRVRAIFMRDYPLIMGITMMISVTVIISNLLADVLYAVIVPRMRYSNNEKKAVN